MKKTELVKNLKDNKLYLKNIKKLNPKH